MYFTATSPYVLMFILLIRGLTLEGASDGLRFYLVPDFSRLQDPQVIVANLNIIARVAEVGLCQTAPFNGYCI